MDPTSNIQDIFELSPLQQGLLFHTLHEPKSSVYFEQVNCALRGVLDVPKFQCAWGEVLSRHDALRMAVQWEDLEKPYQIVYRSVSLPFQFHDWTPFPNAEGQNRLARFLEEDRNKGFELTRAPLMRISVIKMADDRHQFVFSFHHLLLDGWSLMIVLNEIFRAYEAYVNGTNPNLSRPCSFRGYVSWLQQQDLEHAQRFWRRTLEGFIAPNILRSDPEPRPSTDYARRKRSLAADLTRDLEKVARQLKVTVNALVQTAWSILLSRYTAQQDVVWGTTVSGRPAALPGVEQMVGIFINTLPLRAQLKDDATFQDLAAGLQRLSADVSEYAYSPLALVQTWSEVPRSEPLFESLVVFENYPMGDHFLSIGGTLELENPHAFERTNYPLSLLVIPGVELSLEFYYETKRFSADTVDRMLRHMELVLAQVAEIPKRTLRSISLLDENDREQIVCAWNQTTVILTDHSTIQQTFEHHADRYPEKNAVLFESDQLTYAELNARANQVAHLLQAHGVGPGAMVGLLVERSLNSIVGVLGILKSGAAYVPIDSSYPIERVEYVMQDASLGLVLSTEALARKFSHANAAFVCFDRDAALLRSQPAANLGCKVGGHDLAYAIYTSGSTGRPKGVMLEHRGLTNLMEAQLRAFDLTPENRVFQFASLAYDASVFEIAMAWKTGSTLCLASPESTLSPLALAQQLRSQCVTNLTIPPSVLATVIDSDLPELRTIVVAGEVCPAELVEKWATGRRFFNAYGPTETTVWATVAEGKGGHQRPPIGRPISNAQVYILDSELRPVPIGVAGELHIGGAGVGRGYIKQADLTAQRFIPDIFSGDSNARLYKSGDLARWLPDGNIEYISRIDHQVKLRGFRLELEEVEAVLVQCPGVTECAVLLREDPGQDKRLVAYVVVTRDSAAGSANLREFLKKRLPHFMVPGAFVFLDAMPLTTNGKINRRALPPPADTNGPSSAPPQAALECAIAEVWKRVLNVEYVGRDDNFFDLGGHSLMLTQLQTRLKKATERSVSLMDLFRHATIRSLAAHISAAPQEPAAKTSTPVGASREPIAVVGMAGRFPNAPSIDALWEKLRNGEECISRFTDEELKAAGVDPQLLADPNYVKSGARLEGIEMFDGNFFGFNPREVESIDPQHRVFLETAHHALEHAGCDPKSYDGRIAVYGGSTFSTYMANNLLQNADAIASIGDYQIGIGNHKDFLATRVSYKLGLTGPAIAVQATCCTSMVAIHAACQCLWMNEAEMALAGGVTVNFPHPSGYLYHEEGILSPDGHCRAFDAKAKGTVPGNGVAIVALKRLSRALRDGDTIHAVILASASNNDGSSKIGYTAPSVEGQAAAVRAAHEMAGITSDTIGYVEAHGTGTTLGDPIEVEALTQAFRATSNAKQFCALGSVKTNTGHLDSAAGVTGFIKALLQVKHGQIVPNLHFESPNPQIDFANSPFFVSDCLRQWKSDGPRRAGVSSFGIGGTNVHLVLQEPPALETTKANRELHLLTLSAKTATALETLTANTAEFLRSNAALDMADVAFTQHVGRTAHPYRRIAVIHDTSEAGRLLASVASQSVLTAPSVPSARSVVFLFSGQGAQYVNMGRQLYERESLYRDIVDDCSAQLEDVLGLDLRELLFPAPGQEGNATEQLRRTRFTQSAMFVVDYALARLWISWGVHPAAMLGHSIGEYVAACLSGVVEVQEALRLVAVRGRLMQGLPGGSMLALPISEVDARVLLPPGVSIAAVNAPEMCVASGPFDLIDELEREARRKNIDCRRLNTSHAFHSAMLEPILAEFGEVVRGINFRAPKLPYISNVTGTWVTESDVADPDYWTRHLRHTVRFSEGLIQLISQEPRIFLEVGPGHTLVTLARQHREFAAKNVALGSLRHPVSTESDLHFLLTTLGRLWLAGADINWNAFHAEEKRRRLPLPTYPFERQRYFVEPKKSAAKLGSGGPRKRSDVADWFYVPSWKRTPFPPPSRPGPETFLIFADGTGLADALVSELKSMGNHVSVVGEEGAIVSNGTIHLPPPECSADYSRLLQTLEHEGKAPTKIVHLWGVTDGGTADVESVQRRGFFSLMALSQALAKHMLTERPITLFAVTDGAQNVVGTEVLNPAKATIAGFVNVLSQEIRNVTPRWIDVDAAVPAEPKARQLIREFFSANAEKVIAHRGAYRWTPSYQPIPLQTASDESAIRKRGVYLITGGMGGIGLVLAKYLATKFQARLILVGRSQMPNRSEWTAWLRTHDGDDPTAAKIRALCEIEANGGEVFVASVDVTDLWQMRNVVARAESRFGAIHGVIHAAGAPGGENLQSKTVESARQVMLPKIQGTLVLDQLFSHPVDFVVLCSSLASVAAAFGQSDYSAANAFLDNYAHAKARKGERVLSINWDNWGETGMAVNTRMPASLESLRREKLKEAISSTDGAEAFARALDSDEAQIFVSTKDLNAVVRQAEAPPPESETAAPAIKSNALYPRPPLETPYVKPDNDIERRLAECWQELLGIEPIGVYDNFFDLGGHSLLATQLLARLRESFQYEMPLRKMFESPTIASIAESIAGATATPQQSMRELMTMVESLTDEQAEAEVLKRLSAMGRATHG